MNDKSLQPDACNMLEKIAFSEVRSCHLPRSL